MLPAMRRVELQQPRPPATPEATLLASWNHPELLGIVWGELRHRPLGEALPRIRAGLPGEVHATLLLAWVRLVGAALAHGTAGRDLESFLAEHASLSDPALVLVHYSPERLASPRAQREFVLPDRAPLPSGDIGAERLAGHEVRKA